MSWPELTSPPAINDLGLVQKQLYTRADIKRALGLTDAQFIGGLKSGAIPAPTSKRWGHKAWTEEQVRNMVEAAREAEKPSEFGLLTKPR
jgi:hypothetical protein